MIVRKFLQDLGECGVFIAWHSREEMMLYLVVHAARQVLEQRIAALEGGVGALAVSAGSAAASGGSIVCICG